MNYALVGFPIDKSPSPAMHNAAFKALGIDATYALRPAHEDEVSHFLQEPWTGLNVTTPLKTIVAQHVECHGHALRAKAVNTLWRENNRWHGDLTDVEGVYQPLKDLHAQGEALILGAGGAARAAVLALEKLDCVVHVAARRVDQAEALLNELKPARPGKALALQYVDQVFKNLSIVIQSTPVGRQDESHELPWQLTNEGLIAFEMLYNPQHTPFLQQASSHGAQTIQGWQMLLEQGAKAFEIWTHQAAPKDVMKAALLTR